MMFYSPSIVTLPSSAGFKPSRYGPYCTSRFSWAVAFCSQALLFSYCSGNAFHKNHVFESEQGQAIDNAFLHASGSQRKYLDVRSFRATGLWRDSGGKYFTTHIQKARGITTSGMLSSIVLSHSLGNLCLGTIWIQKCCSQFPETVNKLVAVLKMNLTSKNIFQLWDK